MKLWKVEQSVYGGVGECTGECSGEISEVGLGSRELKRGALEGCSEGVRFQVHP